MGRSEGSIVTLESIQGAESFEPSSLLSLLFRSSPEPSDAVWTEESQGPPPRLGDVLTGLLWQRRFAGTYNLVILGLLLLFAAINWTKFAIRAWKRRDPRNKEKEEDDVPRLQGRVLGISQEENHDNIESVDPNDTTNGLERISTKENEETPLLPRQQPQRTLPARVLLWRRLEACLMYQPPPLPYINKKLPSNGASLVILSFFGLNFFYTFYKLPLSQYRGNLIFLIADRFGLIFMVNLPLLYLFAAKNQPIKWLTGYSYEALNIFHRRLGEWLCLLALLHVLGMVGVWYNILRPIGWEFTKFMLRRMSVMGIGAFVAYELLYLTSLGSFRQRAYELFLALHVFLQTAALVLVYLHYHTTKPYALMCLCIFLIDRLVFRLSLKSRELQASLTVLEDGETVLLSADWDIMPSNSQKRVAGLDISQGWKPAEHVFITIPSLSRAHALQAHPFTIASAAPVCKDDQRPTHAWFSLLIRSLDGFTSDLLQYAKAHHAVTVRVDGPYGSTSAQHMIESADAPVFVAGGSGIAVVFPLIWALLHRKNHDVERSNSSSSGSSRSRSKAHLVWVVHSPKHLSWMPEERLAELQQLGLHVVIPRPTEVVGRPDIDSILEGIVGELEPHERAAVVASGPDGLNRSVRNVCASMAWRGQKIVVEVEKFGW